MIRIAKEALNGIEDGNLEDKYRWEQGFTLQAYMSPDSAERAAPSSRSATPSSEGSHGFDLHPKQSLPRRGASWLAANLPKAPLASYDTREGFEQHREWERRLFESRLSMVMAQGWAAAAAT
jgi:hypothetical protein